MNILIIEDNLDAIEVLRVLLKDHNLIIAKTGSEAIDIIDETIDFDLVICDHNFPYFEGERPEGIGHTILFELVHSNYKGHFLHFSQDPCPEKYDLKDNVKFFSLNKSYCLSDRKFLLFEYLDDIQEGLI